MPTREEAIAQLTEEPGGMFELGEETVRGIDMRVWKNAPTSLRAVLELSAGHGDADALVYEDDRYAYAEHFAICCGLAKRLAERHGLGKGDRVAIGMRNYPEWSMAFWATQAAGMVAVPLNAWWTGPELVYALENSGTKVLVVDGERLERLTPHLDDLDLETTIVVRHEGPVPDGVERWEDVLAELDTDAGPPDVEIGPEDDSTIMYTSGTTGRPKGAVHSQRNHITNIMNTAFAGALGQAMSGEDLLGQQEGQPAGLQVFPFFHIGGLTGLMISLVIGSKIVCMYKWDTEKALELIERERITSMGAVPTIVRELLTSPLFDKYDTSSLSGISQGAAPVPPDLIDRIDKQFEHRVRPANAYGLTETTSTVILNAGQEYVENADSVGRPFPTVDVRIVDPETGKDQPDGEVGEIWVKGPNIVRGYWNDPENTAKSFTDGWFHSGDLGYRDAEGRYSVVDRMKDVVLRGGENVYCAEIEAVLFEHPAVRDCAIIGLPHESLGEEVAAVVNLHEGQETSEKELQDFVAERLAYFKVPSKVFFRDEALPRTATGKVLKRELRDELAPAAKS